MVVAHAGCHAGGGNIVQRGAGLSLQELQKNGAISPEEIYKLVYFGKGKMPGYGQGCAPRVSISRHCLITSHELQSKWHGIEYTTGGMSRVQTSYPTQ